MTLGGFGQPLAAERGKRPPQPARPCWQMGPRVALARQSLLAGGGGGAPSGFTRPWAWAGLGARRVGTQWGRQGAGPVEGGRGFPLSGDLRRAAETRAVPLPSSSSWGRSFPWSRGAWGARVERSGWRPGSLAWNRAEAPPSLPRPPILSAAYSLSARVAHFPCPPPGLRLRPPPLGSASRSRASRGAARAGRCGAGRGRAARQPSTSSERRASGLRGAREEGSPPPGPSGAFCSQPEVCMPGP